MGICTHHCLKLNDKDKTLSCKFITIVSTGKMPPFSLIIITIFKLGYNIFTSALQKLVPTSWKKKDVRDDIVLVTGAGSGIGRILAFRFSKLGATVVLWDVNEQNNSETEKLIIEEGGSAFAYTCDLSNKNEIYETAAKVKKEVGIVTILINNAGIVNGKELLQTPDDMIEKTFVVNTLSHFWTTKAFLPDMLLTDKGHIVTIGSLAGHIGINGLVDYCSSKAALIGFHDGLRTELRTLNKENIKTTIICPYLINTGMFSGVSSKYIPELEPYDVAEKIVEQLLIDADIVIIPNYLRILVLMKAFLPCTASDILYDFFETGNLMNNFRGRNDNDKKVN